MRLSGALCALFVFGVIPARAQSRERTGVAVGAEAVYLYSGQDRYFRQPGFGLNVSGEWRIGWWGISGNGALVRFYGKDLGALQVPNVWMYTVGVQARAFIGERLFVGPGVGVYSSSNDLEDEIAPTANVGVRLGRVELNARYKTKGINILEVRAMFHVRSR